MPLLVSHRCRSICRAGRSPLLAARHGRGTSSSVGHRAIWLSALRRAGKPVADAMHELDSYLDKVFMGGLGTVRIVHGKGTGAMREAVWHALSKHPLVKGYRLAYPGEGDAGVTVVYMEKREL